MTHGEMWRDAMARKIAGYCRTRKFTTSGPIKISGGDRCAQYEFDIRDARGTLARLCVEMAVDKGSFVDEGGQTIGDVSAVAFDTLTEAVGLARYMPPSKRQLTLEKQ